jgi:uncharacterized protein DUF4252
MKPLLTIALWSGLAASLGAQQLQLDLDHLAPQASEAVDVSLTGATLQFAAKFLDGKDPQEAQVKKLLEGITGIYVRSYEFKKEGVWSKSDLDRLRNQLRAPQWSRIVGVTSSEDGENAEVFVRSENQKMTGVAILVTEPKELTVVNIVGSIDLNSLAELGGHFGVPKVELPGKKPR